jgi:hypothetical protein
VDLKSSLSGRNKYRLRLILDFLLSDRGKNIPQYFCCKEDCLKKFFPNRLLTVQEVRKKEIDYVSTRTNFMKATIFL